MTRVATGEELISKMKKGKTYLYNAGGDMYCSGFEVVRGDGILTWLAYWNIDGKRVFREPGTNDMEIRAIEMKDKAFELEQAKEIMGDVPVERRILDDAYVTMLETYMEIGAAKPLVPAGYEDFGRYVPVAVEQI